LKNPSLASSEKRHRLKLSGLNLSPNPPLACIKQSENGNSDPGVEVWIDPVQVALTDNSSSERNLKTHNAVPPYLQRLGMPQNAAFDTLCQ
jgi:hypothetical protein